jgi:hypothetical protein
MKNHKNFVCRLPQGMFTAALAVCAVLGWWGALYPQFTLMQSTYEIVREDDAVQSGENVVESELDSSELYWKILDADCSHIRFRSRLLKDLNALQEQRREMHESGKQ